MNKITTLALILGLAGAVSLNAADAGAKAAKKGRKMSPEIIKKYDKNGDGKVDKADNLTKEERQAMKEELRKETTPAAPAPAAPAPAPAPAPAK